MTFEKILNDAKIKPVVVAGKVGLYYVGGDPFSVERSKEIEDKFGIIDLYIGQSPLSTEMNNFVVWANSLDKTVFFNKHEQIWAMA